MQKIHFAIIFIALSIALVLAGCLGITNKPAEPLQTKPTPQQPIEKDVVPEEVTAVKEKPEPAEKKVTTEKTQEELCLEEKSEYKKDQCLKNAAITQNKPYICDSLRVIPSDNCYSETAITHKDSSLCNKISNKSMRAVCIKTIALSEKSYQTCLEIRATFVSEVKEQDECLISLANTINSIEPCLYVSPSLKDGKSIRDGCIFPRITKPEDCDLLVDSSLKTKCINSFIGAAKDTSLCNNISDAEEKDLCIKNIALSTKLYNTCSEISSKEIQQNCLIALVDSNSTQDLCEKIINATEKNSCFTLVAQNEKDSSMCEKLVGTKDNDNECYFTYAKAIDDIDTCAKIVSFTSSRQRDECYLYFALKDKDQDICSNIVSVSEYFNCYYDIAINLDEPSVCSAFTKTVVPTFSYYPIKSICLKNFAIEKNISYICDDIPQTDVKEACLDGNSAFR